MAKKYYDWKGSKNTDEEFISHLARELDVGRDRAKEVIKVFVNSVRYCTNLNTFLSVRRLGVFAIRERKNSKYLDQSTGVYKRLPLMNTIHFKPSVSWRGEINLKIKEAIKKTLDEAEEHKRDMIRL